MITQQEHRFDTPQGQLYIKTWQPHNVPAAPPILLFHESLGCTALWRGFPERLAHAAGRQVIAYDRLGFGNSAPAPRSLDMDFVGAEARHVVPLLLEHLGMDQFVACGHSVGGGMAVETAARFPIRCRALITLGAQSFVEKRTLDGIRAAKQHFAHPDNLARLAKYHGDKTRWVLDAWTETWLSPPFANWTLDPALGRVRCPVLAIHGEQDEYGSAAHPLRIAQGRGRAEIMPGIGHLPHRENEGAVLALIAPFLREADAHVQ